MLYFHLEREAIAYDREYESIQLSITGHKFSRLSKKYSCPRHFRVNWSLSLYILKHLFVRTRKPMAENLTVTSKMKPTAQGRRAQEAFGTVW